MSASYTKNMRFDDILVLLGEFGTYQKRVYALLCLPEIIVAFHMLAMVFIGATPMHRCKLMNWSNDTYAIQGFRHAININLTILISSDGVHQYDECSRYEHRLQVGIQAEHNDTSQISNDTSRCTQWVYEKSEFENTLVTELNLVCGDRLKKSHAQSVFFAGLVIGAIGFGVLADLIGRKKVYIITIVLNAASGLAAAWAPDYYSFILLRMVNGATNAALIGTAFVIGVELVGPKKRMWAGVVKMYFFTLGLVLLAGIAYLIRDWRHLEIAISAPMAIFITYWWLIPESPRWLLAKGRVNDAVKIIQEAARVNKVNLPDEMLERLASYRTEASATQRIKLSDIYKSSTILVRCAVMMFNWFVVNTVYYGIMMNMGRLDGNRYLNFFLGALIEFPSYTMLLLLMDRVGRKPLHMFCMLLSGVACISTIFPVIYAPNTPWITVVLVLVGKFGATGAFCLVFNLTSEMFPTGMRNGVLGAGSLCARFGGVVAPYIVVLGEFAGGVWSQVLPLVIMGGAAIICGFLAFVFPETLGEKLPETIQDGINLGKRHGRTSTKNGFEPVSIDADNQHDLLDDHVPYETRM